MERPMRTDGAAGRGGELGSCLRTWRQRLAPAVVGLPANGSRRTPGLRREELAALAGVSVDYLVRLEQGRAVRPSGPVVAGLARALQLTADERDHLYRVAGQAPPSRTVIDARVTPGVQRLMERLDDAAVSVLDTAWSLVTWNRTWAALMGDPSSSTGRERNLLWRHFNGKPSRIVRTPHETGQFEREVVADLRASCGRYPDDAGLVGLVDDLRRRSGRFDELWNAREVAARRSDRKVVRHPQVGLIEVDCDVLVVEASDLRVVIYTAVPGSSDASKLDLVRVVGLQTLGNGSTLSPG